MKKIILIAIMAIVSQSVFANGFENQKSNKEEKQLVEKKYQCVQASTTLDAACFTVTFTVEIFGDDVCPEDVVMASIQAHNLANHYAAFFDAFAELVC